MGFMKGLVMHSQPMFSFSCEVHVMMEIERSGARPKRLMDDAFISQDVRLVVN